jgi:hypothetical protein
MKQMTFRNIKELVEQNVELQSRVQRLSAELEKRDEELKVILMFLSTLLFAVKCACV